MCERCEGSASCKRGGEDAKSDLVQQMGDGWDVVLGRAEGDKGRQWRCGGARLLGEGMA